MLHAAWSLLLLSHAGALLLGGPAADDPGAVVGAGETPPLLPPVQRPYNVLAFGDSWATIGPTWRMLRRMFIQHGVNAKVASVAVAGTTSCQWAINPYNLVWAGQHHFPGEPVDFVWFTLGGNDLLLDSYNRCAGEAQSADESRKCLQDVARQSVKCNRQLLEPLWAAYPGARVVQNAYDLECARPKCLKHRFPFCKSDIECINSMGTYWGHRLLDPLNNTYRGDGRYTSIRLDGTCQVAGAIPGADIGRPNMSTGSPCEFMVGCEHPAPKSKAAFYIGEAFWNLFFKQRMVVTEGIKGKFVEVEEPDPSWSALTNITEINFECNRRWVPHVQGPDPLNPPCNIGVQSGADE